MDESTLGKYESLGREDILRHVHDGEITLCDGGHCPFLQADGLCRIISELGDACTKRDDRTLIIQLSSPDEKQGMMKRLVEAYDIDEIKVFEPSLNDIFVEFAGEQI